MFSKIIVLLLVIGVFLLPQKVVIPVKDATVENWNEKTFWYEPWGSSITHKGIDIFAPKGTDVLSAVDGIVVFTGKREKGGNVVIVLASKWLLHYYSHLDTIDAKLFDVVKSSDKIGTVGDSGNAKGKPAHLHYQIMRIFPEPWKIDSSTQGYKKAFFVDPNLYLRENTLID